jgi:hypothetical protein
MVEPDYYYKTFLELSRSAEKTAAGELFDLGSEAELSYFCDLSGLQESFRFRVARRSRLLAVALIDEQGALKKELLNHLIEKLEQQPFIPYPSGSADAGFSVYLLKVLKRLQTQPGFYQTIKRIGRPLCHKGAEKLIKETFNIAQTTPVSDAHIRRAVLAACFCTVRQNVGSCFATAPAILIHDEQIDSMVADFYELLSTGKLRRVFGGTEYIVPLSPSVGVGDLRKTLFQKDSDSTNCWLSPGLMHAFEIAGLIDPNQSLAQKISRQKELVLPHLEKSMTVEQLIRKVILKQFELNEADLEVQGQMQHSFLSKKEVWVERRSKKKEVLEQMLHKEEAAKSAFKAFADLPLLKAWEFTLASFSEVKMEFSRWNLYSSLGLYHKEKGGIGAVVYAYIEELLSNSQTKVDQYQKEYAIAYDQLRATEILLKNAGSESEVRRLQAQFQSRAAHLSACLEMRDRFHQAATRYSTFFSFLMEQYDKKFKEYFQEIYDADMQDVRVGPYDDSPAGFRLVYKHGRNDASMWTLIYTQQQWIDALVDFFRATEQHIIAHSDWDGAEKDVFNIVSAIIAHIRTEEFLESAFARMAKAHKTTLPNFPLKKIEQIEKKPWAYTSGGTVPTLLKTYFRRENEMTEEARWVESEADLLGFIIEVLKNLPPRVTDVYIKDRSKGMLMYSPTHAFVLHPGWSLLDQGWQDEGFTYTWIRDRIVLPGKNFYETMLLSKGEQVYLAEQLLLELNLSESHRFRSRFTPSSKPSRISAFRDLLVACVEPPQIEKIDAFLYKMLPLFSSNEWKTAVIALLSDLFDAKKMLNEYPEISDRWVSAKMIKDTAKALFLRKNGSCQSSLDLHAYIAHKAQELGFSSPGVLLFADTNWTNYAFAFVVNPGSSQLELWRTDFTGSEGFPMHHWKSFYDGTQRMAWGVYTHPNEYTL